MSVALAALALPHATLPVEAQQPQSSNANLGNLTVRVAVSADRTGSERPLTPSFSATITSYATSSVHSFVTHVKLTPTVADTGKATVKVGKSGNLSPVTSGMASDAIKLAVGANDILAEVTAEDGTTKTYTVTVTRDQITTVWSATLTARDLGNNAIGCGSGDGPTSCREEEVLSVDSFHHFDAMYTVTEYEVRPFYRSARTGQLFFDLHPKPSQDFVNHATLHVGDQTFALADAKLLPTLRFFYWTASTLSWSAGDEVELTLTLRAQSSNANLSDLTASSSTDGNTFSPLSLRETFDKATTAYSASVSNSTTHVKLTPTVEDSSASVKVGKSGNLSPVTSGMASDAISLQMGANVIEIEVTAEDGTTKTYTVTVTRGDVPAGTVTLVLTPSTIAESGTGNASTVTATLISASSAATTITVSVSPSSSTTLSTNKTLTIAAGHTASTGAVTITAVNDSTYTGDREVTVSGAATNAVGVTNPEDVKLTITEDEMPPSVTVNFGRPPTPSPRATIHRPPRSARTRSP